MIRMAQFSDLHYSTKNLVEADRCFSHAVDRAIHLKVDAAVVSGDSTDHALDLHSPAAEHLARNIRRLAEHCPVLMLQGTFSHEPPGTLSLFRLLGGRYPVYVADRIEQVGLTTQGRWVASKAWCFTSLPAGLRALFSCVPAVNKAVVAATVGASSAAQAVGEHLAWLLRGFAASNQLAHRQGLATIGVSHGTVFGCISEHGVPMAAFDHEFTTGALFGAQAQAFMLGHIHRHQAWENQATALQGRARPQCIAYPGSIGRFHYGEEGDKGFLLWEIGTNEVRFTLERTPARRAIDIVFEGKPDLEVLREVVQREDIAGAFVRLRWTVADEDRHEVNRAAIQKLLQGATEIKLEGRIVPVVRTRAAGISQLASLADKVRAWAKSTDAKPDPLLDCLQALASQTPQAIAERALSRTGTPAVAVTPDLTSISEAQCQPELAD
ncbi:metallophosphatase family protein [Rhodoferax sp.]|uniref:metallophosphoesterase family protein n=1 Tax=Rhodoferax sp. TaxID=50421 RepID=UPI00283EEFF8|nr:metallophosphatase family protein [Rhodoferax sp.]MDR3368861.1 metallophosphatase family protein [Rhodoferax sp.]